MGIGAKDFTDELLGAVFKSRHPSQISCVTLVFFSNGGDVNLKRGDKPEIVTVRG